MGRRSRIDDHLIIATTLIAFTVVLFGGREGIFGGVPKKPMYPLPTFSFRVKAFDRVNDASLFISISIESVFFYYLKILKI
jgi:hypothetical protein